MKKITMLLLAAACSLTVAAARPTIDVAGKTLKTTNPVAKKELGRTASIQSQAMTQKTIGTTTPKKAIGARKADASPSIEGSWTFYMGDYYFQESSMSTIEVVYDATIDGSNVWFEDSSTGEVPFVASFNASTNQLTFTRQLAATSGSYFIFQEPYEYVSGQGRVSRTSIIGQYDPAGGTITFTPDQGLAWPAYSSSAGTGSPLGYFAIYDFEGAERAVPWTLMEDATFNENIIYPLFQSSRQNTVTNAAEVYESPTTPGLYRLMDPFKTLYAALGFSGTSPMMQIDATDPNNVKVEMQTTGINGGTTDGVYYYFNEGWYAEEFDEELDPALACTVTTDSEGYTVITFPYHSFTVYASTSSKFYYGSAFQSVLRFKAPKSETPAPNLSFEDVEMEVEAYSTQAVTTTVDIQLNADPAFLYQGFQFDVTLPEGVEVADAASTVATTITTRPVPNIDNTYRVLGYLDSSDGTSATGTIATLTLSTKWNADTDYPVEGTMAIVAPIVFSTVTGDDITNIEGYEGNITITEKEVPVTDINIGDVTLVAPSSSMADGDVDNITAGESLHIDLTLSPETTTASTTDVKWSANPDLDGIEFEYDAEGNLIVNMEDVTVEEETEVTITGTIGGVTTEYSFTINPVILGDSNDTGADITVADVVTTANYMDKKAVSRFDFPNANVILTEVEGAQVIDQADLTATIDIAFGNNDINRNPQALKRRVSMINSNDQLVADNFRVAYGEQTTIGIRLENTVDYVGLHAEVILPEGMKAIAVTKGERAAAHELDYNIEDGKVYVTLYSLLNNGFVSGEDTLFNLVVEASENCGNLSFENINASDAGWNAYYFGFDGGVNLTGTTGIDGINADEEGARYYDLRGVEIQRPDKGIYIRVSKNGEAVKVVK